MHKVVFALFILSMAQPLLAQQPSPTAVRVILSTPTAPATQAALVTETATWTATALGPVQLEAKAEAGEVNVRSEPDTTAQRLGAIRPGERYVIRGQYFSWYEFDFASSPTGTAWVYGELVDIVGNAAEIVQIDPYAVPTSAADVAIAETLGVIIQTPGGDATATADARILVIATSTIDPNAGISAILGEALPTFTPPSEYNPRVTATPLSNGDSGAILSVLNTVSTQGVPPVLPIMGLALAGLLGIVISVTRR